MTNVAIKLTDNGFNVGYIIAGNPTAKIGCGWKVEANGNGAHAQEETCTKHMVDYIRSFDPYLNPRVLDNKNSWQSVNISTIDNTPHQLKNKLDKENVYVVKVVADNDIKVLCKKLLGKDIVKSVEHKNGWSYIIVSNTQEGQELSKKFLNELNMGGANYPNSPKGIIPMRGTNELALMFKDQAEWSNFKVKLGTYFATNSNGTLYQKGKKENILVKVNKKGGKLSIDAIFDGRKNASDFATKLKEEHGIGGILNPDRPKHVWDDCRLHFEEDSTKFLDLIGLDANQSGY